MGVLLCIKFMLTKSWFLLVSHGSSSQIIRAGVSLPGWVSIYFPTIYYSRVLMETNHRFSRFQFLGKWGEQHCRYEEGWCISLYNLEAIINQNPHKFAEKVEVFWCFLISSTCFLICVWSNAVISCDVATNRRLKNGIHSLSGQGSSSRIGWDSCVCLAFCQMLPKNSLRLGRRFKWDVFPGVSFWTDPRHPASKHISKGTGHKTIFIPFMALKRMHIMNLANKTTVFEVRKYEAPLLYNILVIFIHHACIPFLLILPYPW